MENKEITVENIKIVCDLIKEVEKLRADGRNPRLVPQQRISFAYNYHNIMGNVSLIDILEEAVNKKMKSERKQIVHFITSNDLNKKSVTGPGIPDISEKSLKAFQKGYNKNNWLEEYDLDYEFDNNNVRIQSPTIISILDKNGNSVKIDKNKAKAIKSGIIANDIFPSRQIVRQGFGPYVKGEFDEYIKEIKKGVIK